MNSGYQDLPCCDNGRRCHVGGYLRLMSVLSLVYLGGMLSGCATIEPLPTPMSPEGAMIMLEAKLVGNSWRNKAPRPPTHVYLKRVSAGGGVRKIKETTRNKFFFFYTNVPPGRYQIDSAELIIEAGTVQVTGIVRGSIETPEVRTKFRFSPETAQQTALTLKAGHVVYMGEFTGKYAHNPVLFQHDTLYKWDALGTDGARTQDGEHRAFAFIKNHHPDSEWVQMLK